MKNNNKGMKTKQKNIHLTRLAAQTVECQAGPVVVPGLVPLVKVSV